MQSNSSDNCLHHFSIEILNLFDPELQLMNTKPIIRNKLKELLSELKKFRIQTILVLEYKKRNDCKGARLFASDSDIDEAFNSMHQHIMAKIKSSAFKDWIVMEIVVKQYEDF